VISIEDTDEFAGGPVGAEDGVSSVETLLLVTETVKLLAVGLRMYAPQTVSLMGLP
jgi:hypothetical protein